MAAALNREKPNFGATATDQSAIGIYLGLQI